MPVKGYKAHKALHQDGGSDELDVTGLSGLLADDQHVLDAEAVAAAKTVKLDDFAAPDDNTDLNATAAAHGLLPKLSNVVTEFLNGTGVFSVPAGGVGVKVKAETRAANAASGDVSYTGYGFQPSGLIIFAYLSTSYFSIGSSNPAKDCTNFHLTSTTAFLVDHTRIIYAGTGTNYQFAVVTTYDADGFTLTWTYGGTLTGTIYLFVFAFK